ncbi:MAG: TolC family protein [Alloprevotella sp.]
MTRFFFFLISLFVSTCSFAQKTVPLDEAIQMAIGNSPRLKGAALYADKAKAAKGENWDGGDLQIGFSWGQLNGLEKGDNELTIEQSLGNLLTPYYKNALLKTQAAEGQQRMALIKKEITAEVKRAWFDCLAAAEQMRLCASNDSMAQVLLHTANRKFETGEINRLEHSLLNTLAAEMRTQSMQSRSAWQLALRRLTWICRSEDQLMPAEAAISKIQMKETAAVSQERLELLDNAVQQKRDMVKVERSKFFPELSVGYTRQKMLPYKGLDAFNVGISIPLFCFPQKSRVKQAQVEARIAEWDAEEQRMQLSRTVDELRQTLLQTRATLDYYETAALPEADELRRSALALYNEGETAAADLVQSLKTARDVRSNYVETVRQYNAALIELELYTN